MLTASVVLNVVLALALVRTIYVGFGWMDHAKEAMATLESAIRALESQRKLLNILLGR